LACVNVLALASTVVAIKGFNYGSTFTTGAAKSQSDFEAEFKTAAGLEGTSGFTSARLYTMIQAGTASDVISAIPAALNTGTTLLLGLWASGGETAFANEILALKAAIAQHGTQLANAVDGISVGSEDLYRSSPQGIAAGSNVGATPEVVTDYINRVREAIKGTALANAKVGHVDTWTAWVEGSNKAVIEACDWIGQDAYPYFQQENANSIENSKSLFDAALAATRQAVGANKPIWITETGFPVSGKTVGQAVPSLQNAETYWQEVGCPLFQSDNIWWYTLQDAAPATPDPSFGVIGNTLTTTPLYNLTCGAVSGAGSSSSSSSSSSPSSAAASASQSAGGGQGSSSSSQAPLPTSFSSIPDSGGSPGGVPSSQLVIESSAVVTPIATTTAKSTAAPAPTQSQAQGGGSGSGSGAGAGGGSGSGSGSVGAGGGGSSASATTSKATTAPTTIPTAGQGKSAVMSGASFVGFVFAVAAAVLI